MEIVRAGDEAEDPVQREPGQFLGDNRVGAVAVASWNCSGMKRAPLPERAEAATVSDRTASRRAAR